MQFPQSAPSANPVFYRTYSRHTPNGRESWEEVCDRTLKGLVALGKLTEEEAELLDKQQRSLHSLSSGRWLWVGGTPWIEKSENFYGGYNCSSTDVVDWKAFGLMMSLAMMGVGTGANLEQKHIEQLPPICNRLKIKIVREIGSVAESDRKEETTVTMWADSSVSIVVGDSRQGWVDSYQALMEIASSDRFNEEWLQASEAIVNPNGDTYSKTIQIEVDLGNVRPAGERLNGFGGVSNPAKLSEMYDRIANILNRAVGRKLNSLECCLLIDEAAIVVVAGNVRRSAGIRQFSEEDILGSTAKDNLWGQDEHGNWRIDPDRDALRMANHTRVFHRKPTFLEIKEAVTKQFYSGEGAIQYAPEAIARANADIVCNPELKKDFIEAYIAGNGKEWIHERLPGMSEAELNHRLGRYGLNPCGEIILNNNMCNLAEIHLNTIDPWDDVAQRDAFKAGSICVASLLHHEFNKERYQYSREIDPIVGVSFTGLFDFFVKAFGVEWLEWWEAGRSKKLTFRDCNSDVSQQIEVRQEPNGSYCAADYFRDKEREYLSKWRTVVEDTVWDYCDRHHLRRPNRCTALQPAGTKSLLTGASPGWHPPKAQRFIRRITFRKDDPVALACLDYGYNVVPSQSDKDEKGNLLNDPFDPRCTEWLVEIPTEVPWANLYGADRIEISKFSAVAQFDFYMQVQRHYVRHNGSATIEYRSHEIEPLSEAIYHSIQRDEGYISAALLARFDDHQTFPRLPFEPIDKETYNKLHNEVLARRKTEDFYTALKKYDRGETDEVGPAACDSDKCLFPQKR